MATLVGKLTSQCAKNCKLTLIRRTFTSRTTRFKHFNKQMHIEPPIVLRGLIYRRVKNYIPLSLGVCLCGSAMLGTVVLCAVSDDNLTSKNSENRSAGIIFSCQCLFIVIVQLFTGHLFGSRNEITTLLAQTGSFYWGNIYSTISLSPRFFKKAKGIL